MGEILEKAIRKNRTNITALAKRVNCSRQHIYDLFEEDYIPDLQLIEKIGKVIKHDFSEEIAELKNPLHTAVEPKEGYENLTEKEQIVLLEQKYKLLEQRYAGLMERYRLLQEKTEAVEENNHLLRTTIKLMKKQQRKKSTEKKKPT
jgi:DNA-binding XRE family transcriptional regulator